MEEEVELESIPTYHPQLEIDMPQDTSQQNASMKFTQTLLMSAYERILSDWWEIGE